MRRAARRSSLECASILAAALCAGCAGETAFDRDFVSSELDGRTGGTLPATTPSAEVELPPQVSLDDGLSEGEAVAVALWNNAAFHSDLAELGVARADLVEAGLLPNPVLSVVFPGNSTVLEGTLSIPIQLLQRPTRLAIARLDAERVARSLLQTGLGLARDVRVAFADLVFAQRRQALVGRDAALLTDIAQIAALQLEAGRGSALETARAEADALTATATAQDTLRQTTAAKFRLLRLLGIPDERELLLGEPPAATAELPALAALIDLALASRPDLRAAELAVEAAAESAHWERQQTYDFIALVDLKEEENADLDTGGGVQIDLPVFNRNQGARMRAAARIEQATLRYTAARRAIALDVGESYAAYAAALDAADAWGAEIIPRLETALRDTERALRIGSVAELAVVQAERQLLLARLAAAQARLELDRASAELAYSVGQKLDAQL